MILIKQMFMLPIYFYTDRIIEMVLYAVACKKYKELASFLIDTSLNYHHVLLFYLDLLNIRHFHLYIFFRLGVFIGKD